MKIPVRFPGVFLILAALFFFGTSCGSLPSPAEAELPVPPEAEAEEPAAAAFTGPAAPEASDGAEPLPEAEIPTAEAVPTGPQIPETAEYGELPEPEPELADVRWPDPPREDEAIGDLPEPPPLTLLQEAEPLPETPEPVLETPEPLPEIAGPLPEIAEPVLEAPEPLPEIAGPLPEIPEPVPETPEPPPEIAGPLPETPAPLPPDPPRNLRPTEALPPPEAAREKPPVPVNPVPDLPARSPAFDLLSPGENENPVVFSRVVRASVGQLIEIPFRGTGWVFLGELEARRGIAYGSRRLDPEGQSFIFRSEEVGDYALKFYKQDFIRDYILNDYVRVIIGEPPGTASVPPPVNGERVIAEPRWPPLSGEASVSGGTAASGGTASAAERLPLAETRPAAPVRIPEPPPVSTAAPEIPEAGSPVPEREPALPASDEDSSGSRLPELSPQEYIRRAREEYETGKIPAALLLLDQFREAYPAGSDEAWWLYGQILEANGPNRDIRSALDYYRRLIREFPQSSRFEDARRRAAYLERYYFTIQ